MIDMIDCTEFMLYRFGIHSALWIDGVTISFNNGIIILAVSIT